MLFTFNQALAISAVIALLGVFAGLIVRLLREKVETKKIFHGFGLAFMFLIVYPLIFPGVILLNKKAFAKFLVNCTKNTIDGKLSSKKEKELYKTILQTLNTKEVLYIWFGFLRDIFANYDEFIRDNIKIIKEVLREKEEGHDTKVCFMDYSSYEELEPDTILEYPEEIVNNKSSFFGLYVNYQLQANIA